MRKAVWWLLFAAALALLAAIPYFASLKHPQVKAPPGTVESPVADVPEAKAPPAEPAEPRHPHALPALEKPRPALDTSDATMRNSAHELWGDKAVDERFQFKDFVRRVVATIDNLPRRKVAQQLMPVKRADGAFLVAGDETGYTIAPENAQRYKAYLALLESVSAERLVGLYIRLYPLFQQAYEDLGYPGQYFNDRLMVVIDDMLAAPVLETPAKLLRPKVFYVYADPELEASSAGQKILMRIGNDNAQRVKARLKAIRAELEKQSVPKAR